jgi:hypothetical protein
MPTMTKQQAREFVDRWRLVDQRLLEEIRQMSPELRAKQVTAAYQAGKAMASTSDGIPFEKWQQLREKFNGR